MALTPAEHPQWFQPSLKKSMAPPDSITEMLAMRRDDLVREAISHFQIIFAQANHQHWELLNSYEIRIYNHVSLIADQDGYAKKIISRDDTLLLESEYVPEIRRILAMVFVEKYTLFANFIGLKNQIKSALSFYDYKNKKPAGESYTLGEGQKFADYLNRLCGLSLSADQYLLKDESGSWIDIDWPALLRKLWQKMQQEGYFIPYKTHDKTGTAVMVSDAHRQFFEFLQPSSPDKYWQKPEEWQDKWRIDWREIPYSKKDRLAIVAQLFSWEKDFINCIDAFGLDEVMQEKLLLGFVGPAVQDRRLNIDKIALLALKSTGDNHVLKIMSKHLTSKASYFYQWQPDIDYFWQYARYTNDYDLLEKMRSGVFKEHFLEWQMKKEINPEGFLTMIGVWQRFRPFATWIIRNIKFSNSIADYEDSGGNTLLHHAVIQNDVLAVKLLLAMGVPISYQNNVGYTAEMLASDKPLIKVLIAKREIELQLLNKLETQDLDEHDDLSLINKEDIGLTRVAETLLMCAAAYGRSSSVKKLIAAGVPIELMDDEGKTALDIAIEKGHVQIVALLIKALNPTVLRHEMRIADVGKWLKLAVENNQIDIVKLLQIEFGDELLNEDHMLCGGNQKSLLMIAAENASLDMVKWLISTGEAGIGYVIGNETALSIAAKLGHLAIVEELLAAGDGDFYYQNSSCKYITPALVAAARNNHKEIFKKLLSVAIYVPLHCEKNKTGGIVEDFPKSYLALLWAEFIKRSSVFAAIEQDSSFVDLSILPVDCLDGNHESLLEKVIKKNRLDLVRTLLARGVDFFKAFAMAIDTKNQIMIREFLLHISQENRAMDFPWHFMSLLQSTEGLEILLQLCEEQPNCWQSLFAALLQRTADDPDHENRITTSEPLLIQLINLASKDIRIARAVFANKLHWYVCADDQETAMPLNEYLQLTPEGQQVLKFLQKSTDLTMLITGVRAGASERQAAIVHRKKLSVLDGIELPIAADKPLGITIKKTEGDGNCAFHAVFGVWDSASGLIVDAEHLAHRQQLAAAVLGTKQRENPDRYQLIKECILALMHEAVINPLIFRQSPGLTRLVKSYQANSLLMTAAEQVFQQAVSSNELLTNFIETHCAAYVSPSGKKLSTFKDKYIHMKNTCKAAFEQLIDEQGLFAKYITYQALSLRDFSKDISAVHIKEYAAILGKPAQYLLAQEINLLAQIFNKKITYYLGIEEGQTLEPVVFNKDGVDAVAIRHNGVNHFERIMTESMAEQTQQPSVSKSKALFFVVPPALPPGLAVSSCESSRSSVASKRRRDDGDFSAHGKQAKVDESSFSIRPA